MRFLFLFWGVAAYSLLLSFFNKKANVGLGKRTTQNLWANDSVLVDMVFGTANSSNLEYQTSSITLPNLPDEPDLFQRASSKITTTTLMCHVWPEITEYRDCTEATRSLSLELQGVWRRTFEDILPQLASLTDMMGDGEYARASLHIWAITDLLRQLPTSSQLDELRERYHGPTSCIDGFDRIYNLAKDTRFYPNYNEWVSGGSDVPGVEYFLYWDQQVKQCEPWFKQARKDATSAATLIQLQTNLQQYAMVAAMDLGQQITNAVENKPHEARLALVRFVTIFLAYTGDSESVATFYRATSRE